ncbi:hypothetical protein Tco_0392989 [Tanacetum coccineum]
MVAYLEKTDGNTEFHQIMDFVTRSLIYYTLTVRPIVSTSLVERFWTTAKSRTVNNISYIDATVAGKPVTISKASIRSDLLFDDADGIDSLTNQAIFDNIQLIGYEGDLDTLTFNKALFSPQWKFLFHTMNHCISSKSTFWDQIPNNIATAGKNFSGKVTPLFDSMLIQQTKDEGDASERPSDSPPIPSPPHPSEDQPQIQPDPSPRPSPTTHILDSIPEGSGGNHGGQSSNDASLSGNEDGLTLQSVYDICVSLCKQVTAQAKEIKSLKAQVKKLKKGVKLLITHHKAWMKTRLAKKTSLKKKGVHKEYVSKKGRKSIKTFKGKPYLHKDPAFDDLDDFVDVDDTLDYMETGDDQNKGRTSSVVLEEKESENKEVSIEGPISTDKQNKGTDKKNDGTDKQDGGTDSTKVSTDRQGKGTADQDEGKSVTQTPTSTPTPTTPTPIVFGDDETIARVLIITSQNKEKLKEKEKGIDPKDKGKKRIEEEDESDTESERPKSFKEEWEAEEVRRKGWVRKKLQRMALSNE